MILETPGVRRCSSRASPAGRQRRPRVESPHPRTGRLRQLPQPLSYICRVDRETAHRATLLRRLRAPAVPYAVGNPLSARHRLQESSSEEDSSSEEEDVKVCASTTAVSTTLPPAAPLQRLWAFCGTSAALHVHPTGSVEAFRRGCLRDQSRQHATSVERPALHLLRRADCRRRL